MEDRIGEEDQYEEPEKVAIGKWFLLHAPPGQVSQVAKGRFSSPIFKQFFCGLSFMEHR
jgi:hypothetical protein